MIDDRCAQFAMVQREALETFIRKNTDYGDSFAEYGVIGVIVRMGDKIRRAITVDGTGITLVASESLRDTLMDLHNYAAMGVMLLDETREGKDVGKF